MSRQELPDLDIAIIGMAGRFPGADSIDAYWQNLLGGVESIRDLSDPELRASGLDEQTLADRRLVKRAADLRGIELFDAGLFGFTPREAELMDPQFRVFLEDAWTALEDAARHADGQRLRVGVFAGASPNSYFLNNISANRRAAEAVGGFQTAIGNERDYLATHVAYRLDLRGPSIVVQTACSTSLVAVHLACQSLLGGECDIALAGGVSIGVPQTSGYVYEEGGIASPDGHCRAFDASAAGCVKGNGSGVVVLRRLADARAEGDRIRAVIKGSAVNNDGSAKVGFTAPSEEGQAAVIAEALAAAGVEPSSIGYVEAHGTATALGDPVEVAALSRAFGNGAAHPGTCALGSVKTNVGHLDAAAGVAGLIKAALAVERGIIPPSLHYQRPNPKIDFARSAFYVNTQARAWAPTGAPRRAGVSSFGIGGTNAHVIVEQPPAAAPESARRRPAQLLTLSAATAPALAAACTALASRLREDPALDLADVAYVLQTGRRRLAWRRAVVAPDAAGAVAALESAAAAGAGAGVRDVRRATEVAFLFPGQGAQHVGMARGLYAHEPAFRNALDRCAQTLQPLLGQDLREIIGARGDLPAGAAAWDAAEARLRDTAVAQPALFAVSYALAQLWMSWGVRPGAMAGHSVGEYVAACLAGVLTLDDALAVVAERGRLMGSMPAGAMLAVALAEGELSARLASHPGLVLAVVNAPASCVAAGPEAAIARLEAELAAAAVPARRLRTSHAFHSPMMDPILDAITQRLRRVALDAPAVPFLSNLTGTWIEPAQAVDPAYWAAQLRRTVRFADNVAALSADSTRAWLEVGPGTTLATLARGQAPQISAVASLRPPAAQRPRDGHGHAVEHAAENAVGRASEHADAQAVLEALGRLWCAGVDVDWEAFHEGHGRRRVALPTYPFERARHWIEPGAGAAASTPAAAPAVAPAATPAAAPAATPGSGGDQTTEATDKNADPGAWFYVPGWKRSFPRAGTVAAEPAWLVFDDGSPLARAVVELGRARGARVAAVRAASGFARLDDTTFALDPRRREDYDALFRQLRERGLIPGRIVHLWCRAGARAGDGEGAAAAPRRVAPPVATRPTAAPDHVMAAQDRGFFALLHTLQGLGHAGATDVRATVVTARLFDVAGEAPEGPERATLVGICRVVPQEYEGFTCRLLDLLDDGPAALTAVAAELDCADREPVVAWRGGHRWVPASTRVQLEVQLPGPALGVAGGVYVLTGGTGTLELGLAARLAADGARALAFLECDAAAAAAAEGLRARGLSVTCFPARVTDAAAVERALVQIRADFGRVDAVFHTAGVIGGGLIQLKQRAEAEAVLAPRLVGATTLAALLGADERLVLFSSAISATGVLGQVDYCAASAFLDALAQCRRPGAGPQVCAIDWGTAHWDRWQAATGPGSAALLEQLRAIQAAVGITVEEGVAALARALTLRQPQIVVCAQDFDQLVARSTAASVLEFLEGVEGAAPRAVERNGREVVPPRTATERRVGQAWTEILGITPIGRNDNFFEVGGNSLLAIQLASHLRKAFDVDLTIASLFEAADLARLSAVVDGALEERRQAEEAALLLDEIEGMSEEQVRVALAAQPAAAAAEATRAAGAPAAPGPAAKEATA